MDKRYVIEYTFPATRTIVAGLTVRGIDDPVEIARERFDRAGEVVTFDEYHPMLGDDCRNQAEAQPAIRLVRALDRYERWPKPDRAITHAAQCRDAMEVVELLRDAERLELDAQQKRAEAVAVSKLVMKGVDKDRGNDNDKDATA